MKMNELKLIYFSPTGTTHKVVMETARSIDLKSVSFDLTIKKITNIIICHPSVPAKFRSYKPARSSLFLIRSHTLFCIIYNNTKYEENQLLPKPYPDCASTIMYTD